MKRYEVLVFFTGGIVLSLELLASRIMTPYFGVSLYIWTGILSVTLVFLALGYFLGGKATRLGRTSRDLELTFLSALIVAALAILLAAAIYPALFPILARRHLIVGSFVAAGLLLALPLILLSALNPILIAMQPRNSAETGLRGDSGAGRIFFISTIGSVCGVLFTAFVFIPNIGNFQAILTLGILLCLPAILFAQFAGIGPAGAKWKLSLAGGFVAAACIALLLGREGYLRLITSSTVGQQTFNIVAEYTSVFGNIKIAEVRARDGDGAVERYLIKDGVIQAHTSLNNQSLAMYSYALRSLAHSHAPTAGRAIVFGLGAGIVPRNLARDGLQVSVVEINPDALAAAVAHFGFQADAVDMHLQDARTFAHNCENSYDVAIVDLFRGDSIPDYLRTREFFFDLKRCLKSDGVMVLNTVLDTAQDAPNQRLFATIASAFPILYLSGKRYGNSFIVGTSAARPVDVFMDQGPIPEAIAPLVRNAVFQSRRLAAGEYARWEPVTDDGNIFSVLFAKADLLERSILVKNLPPRMLVN
ncbi:MAG: fused MFS/spermidine synthase [Alphaproteobacteria bacterium]|jgi:spermidine synthase|nr:fused MFS/spermidine synthase [Alphaproteobacteria bacterium]